MQLERHWDRCNLLKFDVYVFYVFAKVANLLPHYPWCNAWDAEDVLINSWVFLYWARRWLCRTVWETRWRNSKGTLILKQKRRFCEGNDPGWKKQQRKQARSPEITDPGISSDVWSVVWWFFVIGFCRETHDEDYFRESCWNFVSFAWDSFSGHALVDDLMFYHRSFYSKLHDACIDIATVVDGQILLHWRLKLLLTHFILIWQTSHVQDNHHSYIIYIKIYLIVFVTTNQ